MSTDGQGTKRRRKIAEYFNRLSRAHKRYRRQTDDRHTDGMAIAYSEREPEFTFANNSKHKYKKCKKSNGYAYAVTIGKQVFNKC